MVDMTSFTITDVALFVLLAVSAVFGFCMGRLHRVKLNGKVRYIE